MCFGGNYSFSHLTIKDGLSQSTIKSIYQDSKGFLWLGSADGLNKYDGYKFTVYRNDPYDASSIAGNDISCIYENPSDSILWIGTQSSGLSMYNRKDDTFYRITEGYTEKDLPSNKINALKKAPDGKLWIATSGGGIFWYNAVDSAFMQPDYSKQAEFRNVLSFDVDEEGIIWLGTDTGLYRYDTTSDAPPEKISLRKSPSVRIQSLVIDRMGYIWLGTQGRGLIRYRPDTGEIINYTHNPSDEYSVASNNVRCILQRQDGSIWIGTENGLCLFNFRENNFRTFSNNPVDPESMNDNSVFSIFEDNSGTLWVGTYFGGISKLYPDESRFNKYSNFHKTFNLNRAVNHITGLYKDLDEVLWAATLKGLLAFPESHFEESANNQEMEMHFMNVPQRCVFGDSYNNLYVANDSGLYIRRPTNAKFELLKPENMELNAVVQNVMNGFEDSKRNVWFLTSAGLIGYNPKTNVAELRNPRNENGGTNPKYFISGIEAANGKLWIGTIDGELYRYDRYIYQFEKILPSDDSAGISTFNRIFSICEQVPGIIWFGTNNGLYRYNEKEHKLKRFMDSDGLSNNVVYSVVADSKNQLWCSTNMGVSVFQPDSGTFINYTWEDGLQSNEFNQNAYFKSKKGIICFGGIDGFNIIDPERINPNQFIPPIYISGLTINHEEITPATHPEILTYDISETEEIVLNHKQSVFSFEFTALNYIHPQKNRYRYKLAGYDADWIEEQNERTAGYTNLNPGQYTFMVQGANNSGIWNEQPASIKVTVLPPFWLTAWFKILMLVLFLLGIYFAFYLRIRTMRIQTSHLRSLVAEKTAALQKTNEQVELKNRELSGVNKQLKQRNREIEETNQQLNEQNEHILSQRDKLLELSEQLKQVTQAKINFFTHISHEFRTPLTLIMGPLSQLSANIETVGRDEIGRKMKIVHANATRLLMLINQLLDFRKIESGNMQLFTGRKDMVRFVDQIVGLFSDMAQRKQINLVFDAALPEIEMCFDADKMEKVIFNLLSNAFKHTPEKGMVKVSLDVSSEQEEMKQVQIAVSDSGPGISNEFLPFVFNDFWQDNGGENKFPEGSGIGLALVKKYTELHNGNVVAESTPGEGACFKVIIPWKTECNEEMTQENTFLEQICSDENSILTGMDDYSSADSENIVTGEEYNFPLVLVVEDDESIRSYLKEILLESFRVLVTDTVEEGLKLVSAQLPNLIISDVLLPDSSGFDLCQRVKGDFKTCHIPVVLLTALSNYENHLSGIKCGADAFITKPFDVQQLLLTVGNLINQRKKLQAKFMREGEPVEDIYSSKPEEQEFLNKVIAEVEKNLNNTAFDVEQLCRSIGLSQPQTYRKIKALTDLSISEFMRNIRLKKAARMLASGSKSISEVAYEVGFNDPNYFSKCFVKVFGKTPTTYMKLKR